MEERARRRDELKSARVARQLEKEAAEKVMISMLKSQ